MLTRTTPSILTFLLFTDGSSLHSSAISFEQWQEMKEKYENNEITKEALEDWKANYPDSLKKEYVPFEESNLKRFNNGMSVKVPPETK